MNAFLLKQAIRSLVCCVVMISGLPTLAFAGWVQGEATVALNGADLNDVRGTAIQNAVADAAFQSGGTIFAEDIMVNGLLLSSKAEIRSQGRIQRVEIMSETLSDDSLTVVVNVNITPLFDCENNALAHRVLVTEFPLIAPQQAATGQLYSLGSHVSQRFTQQLNSFYKTGNISQIGLALVKPDSWLAESLTSEEWASKSTFLRTNYGQQFVIFGFVKDISLFEQVSQASSLFDTDDVTLRRNFTIQVYVLDTYKSKIIFNDSYHSEADWAFASHYTVDVNNSLLWRSDYGRMMLNTIHAAVTDIHAALQCETIYAQVIDITTEHIAIDLGLNSDLQIGDKFLLVKQRGLPELRQTQSVGLFTNEDIQLEVEQISEQVSLLRRTAGTDGIQVGDLVTPLRN